MKKLSDYFSSMEEVKSWLEKDIKPFVSRDNYRALEKALGLGENEGITVYVEGIGDIDSSIAGIIKELNDAGFTTLASCSGLISEHPG